MTLIALKHLQWIGASDCSQQRHNSNSSRCFKIAVVLATCKNFHDTFGNVTLEAMSSGLPVVAFEHAAAKELIVSEMHGLLADAHHPHQFVSHALKMATTPALRLHLQSHVRARAMEMGWSSIMEKLEAVYSTLS